MTKIVFVFLMLWGFESQAAWPDSPWLHGIKPANNSIVSAVAFGSPLDFQFVHILEVWKRLSKKYQDFGVDFVVITQPENSLPYSETIVEKVALSRQFSLPTYVDYESTYSKKWRAYVTPTVNLVLRNDKVVGFDPGNFDVVVFERSLQKALKEAGINKLPPKDSTAEEEKSCAHGSTYFLGSKQRSIWGVDPVQFDNTWTESAYSLDKLSPTDGQIVLELKDNNLAVVAESTNDTAQTLKVSLRQEKIPASLRGSDIQESKNGDSVVNVKDLRVYDLISSQSAALVERQVILQTNSKNLRLWAFQTLPHCRAYK